MSEYTPTIAEVREVWVQEQDITHGEGADFHAAEFNRWIVTLIERAIDLGYAAGLRAASLEAANYTGHPYNAAATLALGFKFAADEIEKED